MAKKNPNANFEAIFLILFLFWKVAAKPIYKLWQKLGYPVQTATF